MNIIFLGSGDALGYDTENAQSNVLLESPSGKRLLIDCGSDAKNSLHELNLKASSLDSIYISHLHSDHIGGLEWLGFTRFFEKPHKKPKLYLHSSLTHDLWNHCLSGGMSCLEHEKASLESLFDVHSLEKGFEWEGSSFELVKMTHVFDQEKKVPCYGLFFEINKRKVFFTSDTRFTPETLMPYYEKSDLIFHECETKNQKSPVHTHYTDLIALPEKIRKKMWLYHYNPGKLPDAKKDGFKGFVKKHQEFDLS